MIWNGRIREIDEICRILKNEFVHRPGGVIITGGGGFGKTVLAKMIAKNMEERFDISSTWIEARSPDVIFEIFEKIHKFKDRHMIVVDGLDEATDGGQEIFEVIKESITDRRNINILITSRKKLQDTNFFEYSLGPMSDADIKQLLINTTGTTLPIPNKLLPLIEGHPISASLIGSLSKNRQFNYWHIVNLLEDCSQSGLVDISGRPISARSAKRKQIITDIRNTNEEILRKIKNCPDIVFQISPRKFEEISAEMFSRLGYSVQLTPRSKDGGLDIMLAQKSDLGSFLYFVECKQYAANRPVGVSLVNSLIGVVERGRATAGLLPTTSRFTTGARSIEKEMSTRLSLKYYTDFRSFLEKALP